MIALLFGLLAGPMQTGPVSIVIPAGACSIVRNGEPISLSRLRAEAKGWKKRLPEFHFLPSPDADYRCVEPVLRVVRESIRTKIVVVATE